MNLLNLNSVLDGEPKYRSDQIFKLLFKDFISDWSEATTLPKSLRARLAIECPLGISAELSRQPKSRTAKALLRLADGESIETVLIENRDGRQTICVSSQVGCPLACSFCATGAYGFKRNLSADEIVEQVLFWSRHLHLKGAKVDNVVFMGMGEPFLNYEEFIRAARFLNNPEALNIGARRLSVSTAGLSDGIRRLAREDLQINLAISLHAPNDALRGELMPIAHANPLRSVFAAVDEYIKLTGRRVMFEYLMLRGVNDGEEEATELVQLMRKPLYMVNLIPYNPTGRYQPSSPEAVERFRAFLERNRVAVTVRHSSGAGILAACGQLRGADATEREKK